MSIQFIFDCSSIWKYIIVIIRYNLTLLCLWKIDTRFYYYTYALLGIRYKFLYSHLQDYQHFYKGYRHQNISYKHYTRGFYCNQTWYFIQFSEYILHCRLSTLCLINVNYILSGIVSCCQTNFMFIFFRNFSTEKA